MEQTSLTIAGQPTHALVAGQGPSLVLLHGSADSPLAWQAAAELLADRFKVWAPALPPLRGGLAVDADLPWLDALMEHTGARVLGGHSYGALLALRWALAQPGKLDRLVVAEPIAWGVGQDLPEFAARRAQLARCIGWFTTGQTEAALTWLVDYWNGAGFWARLPDKVRAALVAGAVRTHAEVASGGADRTSEAELASLPVSVRVLVGGASTAESLSVARRIASALPDAKLVEISGAGHQFLRSHPEVIAAACVA